MANTNLKVIGGKPGEDIRDKFYTESVTIHVVGPEDSPVVAVGEDVVLECRTEPNVSLMGMEVRWFKNYFSAPVHLYAAGRDQPTVQDAAYKGRTQLYREELPHGNASLKLKNVNAHDSGEYRCFIDYKDDYDETKILLTVGGVGQQPWIDLEGTHHHGVRLVCRSDGWYPVPTVHWLNGNEENLARQSLTTRKDQSSGLYAVFSQIDVTSDSVNKYSCVMRNNVLNEEKEAQIQLSGGFFPRTNAWMVAFIVFLILVIGAIVCEVFRHRGKRVRIKELKLFCILEGYNDHEINEVSVTLEGETANPKLELRNQDRVRLTEVEQNCPDTGKRFTELESVLGLDEFRSGRYYWVVEVAMNRNWSLGVATETAERNGMAELKPENGFWTIGRVGDELHANDSIPITLSTQPVPEKLGIYLSYESGIISFHSLPTKTCIYTFTVDKFEGKLYPFIRTSHVDKWVKVSSGSVLDLHKEPHSRGTFRNRFRRLWSGKPY
ncbi:butyrophilin subfamily 1 member A1-like [Hypanus sabinus]|uniref:butyrophilin subfamily 1 member A1-like n=1 Tax=Hypanus sabinus TaxID=79690 RepID=UPI0028C3DE0A|nr:butyrophilin subfamily 1 member A1-like [Hypanus sabinus]